MYSRVRVMISTGAIASIARAIMVALHEIPLVLRRTFLAQTANLTVMAAARDRISVGAPAVVAFRHIYFRNEEKGN